ncbi:MAG: ATP-binding cassette domain-containing protein [bacterium]
MQNDSVVLRFDEVTYKHGESKTILDEVGFSVRNGSKIALMGQNGAGKTTLFRLILGEFRPNGGKIFLTPEDATVGIAKQVIPPDCLDMTVRDWFAGTFSEVPYNLDRQIADAFSAVNFSTDLEKRLKEHSGGQQARLLLAYALVQSPDILLLDEPTNNLDQDGIDHLTGFLMMYEKTVIVISHDAEFLNAFTDGVLYLDVFNHKIEQYRGNYLNVVEEIEGRIERERMLNARAEAEIKRKMDQSGKFAHKGGKLRSVAKTMRERAEEMRESMVEVRREDKTIREFEIPAQEFSFEFSGKVLEMTRLGAVRDGQYVSKDVDIVLRRGTHCLLAGPNGIGKSTLLRRIFSRTAEGVAVGDEVRMGYYSQDFSTLDYGRTAYDTLLEVMREQDEQVLRSTAAGFLLDGKALASEVGSLSEGQKGLLSIARLVLLEPGLLILDEPTNHINFRHLPVLAKAFNSYQGAMIMVSHIPDFVSQVRIDETIDLGKAFSG